MSETEGSGKIGVVSVRPPSPSSSPWLDLTSVLSYEAGLPLGHPPSQDCDEANSNQNVQSKPLKGKRMPFFGTGLSKALYGTRVIIEKQFPSVTL